MAGTALAASVAVIVTLLTIHTASNGEISVLIGTLGSDRLAGLALITALASLTVGIFLIPVRRPWLAILVPARLAGVAATCLAALAWMVTASATVVPLISAGCETGYVVEEESFLLSGRGTVYRTDGIFVTAVEQTTGDDGYHPFDDGAYAVEDGGDSLRVWYNVVSDDEGGPISTRGEPAFTLPKLRDRALACGFHVATRTTPPQPPTAPEYGIGELRGRVDEMIRESFAASVGSVRDGAGNALDSRGVMTGAETCADGGTRITAALDFTTTDNAVTLARILEAWDRAGYLADRAIQEDLRTSATLPVQQMSVRDSSTIDGLIHMQIASRCTVTH